MIDDVAIFIRVVQGDNGVWADSELSGKQVRQQLISGIENSNNKFTAMIINLLLITKSKDISLAKV